MLEEVPRDPFADDPDDPAASLGEPEEAEPPLSTAERDEVATELADVELFRSLLEPLGYRGLALDCSDCEEPHFFGWDLLRGNLRQIIADGRPQVHEPAFQPDPSQYVTWDYARGYVDGVIDSGGGASS